VEEIYPAIEDDDVGHQPKEDSDLDWSVVEQQFVRG
jgi:hypothetical protein